MEDIKTKELIEAAAAVREHAYAPYSGYSVGAAIRDETGGISTGCNVENVSFGLTVCAERAAICNMVGSGVRAISEVAVVTPDGGAPCGMCLQSMLEFSLDPKLVKVAMVSGSGSVTTARLSDLIPMGFQSNSVRRT